MSVSRVARSDWLKSELTQSREVAGGMARQAQAAARVPSAAGGPGAGDPRVHQEALRLVSRLLVAQAGATAAIGLAYNRRNVPLLLLTILIALALCGLAGLIRSGSHPAWVAAMSLEACLVALGLFRFVYDRYLGGTLLAIITLGTLLHPAVARAFAAAAGWHQPMRDHPGIAEGTSDALRSGAAS
jgi:hypothetical protein